MPARRACRRRLHRRVEPPHADRGDYGPGDPLRWSAVKVEILFGDWLPRKVIAPPDYLAMAPDLLRTFVCFAHAEVGVRPELTDETLAAIAACERSFCRSSTRHGRRGRHSRRRVRTRSRGPRADRPVLHRGVGHRVPHRLSASAHARRIRRSRGVPPTRTHGNCCCRSGLDCR